MPTKAPTKAPRKVPANTTKAPTKAIAKVDSGPKLMAPAAAQSLTKKIRDARNRTLDLVIEAIAKRVWLSMHDTEGKPYKGWIEYAQSEFDGGIQISASRHERPEIVGQLHDAGASQSIIALITGTTQQTVSNDIKSIKNQRVEATNNLLPDGDAEPPPLDVDEAPLPTEAQPPTNGEAAAGSTTSIGTDNKEYPRATTAPKSTPKAKATALVTAATKLAKTYESARAQTKALFEMPGARGSAEVEQILGKSVDTLTAALEDSGLVPAAPAMP